MWCVLAHICEQDELLTNVRRVLKPGAILLMQTPRWSAMDIAALSASSTSGGRITRVLDQRVSEYHMTLHSAPGLATHLSRLGLDVLDVTARSRYDLQLKVYLTSLGVPERASQAVARVFDLAVDHDLFFRNVLELYARKPDALSDTER